MPSPEPGSQTEYKEERKQRASMHVSLPLGYRRQCGQIPPLWTPYHDRLYSFRPWAKNKPPPLGYSFARCFLTAMRQVTNILPRHVAPWRLQHLPRKSLPCWLPLKPDRCASLLLGLSWSWDTHPSITAPPGIISQPQPTCTCFFPSRLLYRVSIAHTAMHQALY